MAKTPKSGRHESDRSHTWSRPTGNARLYLSEAQRRTIGSALRVAEERAVASRHLLNRTGEIRSLLTYRDECDAKKTERLVALLDQFLGVVNKIAEHAGVSPVSESIPNRLSANMSSAWEIIEDIRSRRLKGYGDVHPDVPDQLDPLIDEASGLIRTFLNEMRTEHEESESGR